MENFNDGTDDQLQLAEYSCKLTASKNGHSVEDAEDCEDGSVGCMDCPFSKNI